MTPNEIEIVVEERYKLTSKDTTGSQYVTRLWMQDGKVITCYEIRNPVPGVLVVNWTTPEHGEDWRVMSGSHIVMAKTVRKQ